jgi:hypothetical protein
VEQEGGLGGVGKLPMSFPLEPWSFLGNHSRGSGGSSNAASCRKCVHETSTKVRGVENHPAAKTRGTQLLRLENHTKSQWNFRNSSKWFYVTEKKQI